MRSVRLCFVLLLAAAAPSTLSGSVCVPGDTLFNYMALGSTGCQVGDYTVKDFTYSPIGSPSVIIANTDIMVTPVFALNRVGLKFSSTKFNVSGSDFARYLLGYTWDPGPIRSLEDILDPPVVPPGTVTITTKGCKNSPFPCTPANTVTLTVFDFGTSNQLFDSVIFTPDLSPGVLGIENTIDLEANGASAAFAFFTNQVVEGPEPSTFATGVLLVALAFTGWRRRP